MEGKKTDEDQDESEKRPLVTDIFIIYSNKSMTVHILFIQRPGRNGSKRRSRNSFGSHGSIKDMGLQHKIIDKMLFCMGRNSRIGVFLSIEVTTEVLGLVSLVSTIMLLIKIGFPLQAVILLLLSVRILIVVKMRNIYL